MTSMISQGLPRRVYIIGVLLSVGGARGRPRSRLVLFNEVGAADLIIAEDTVDRVVRCASSDEIRQSRDRVGVPDHGRPRQAPDLREHLYEALIVRDANGEHRCHRRLLSRGARWRPVCYRVTHPRARPTRKLAVAAPTTS